MNLPENRLYTFFVTGVPRSGTTIIERVLDSCDNVTCLGEPHWKAENEGREYDFFGESITIYTPGLVDFSKQKPEALGYKETWRFGYDYQVDPHRVDFFLIVFRDPVMVHSSQRALGWTEWDNPEIFLASYYSLLTLLKEYPNGIPLVYEDFTRDPLPYLNSRLPYPITGPFDLKPKSGDERWGDPLANRSTSIVPSQRQNCLSAAEIAAHEPAREIWRKYRDNAQAS